MPDGTFADLNGRRTVKIDLRDSHGRKFSIKAKFVTKGVQQVLPGHER
jgi:hypothetical protein